MPPSDALDIARARVLHDLCARDLDDARTVSLLDEVVAGRRWWVDEWPDGAAFLPGLVAQDLQDALHDRGVRWPQCTACDTEALHSLHVDPPLDVTPSWVCDEGAVVAARVGELDR
ncbi:hypothetical protein MU582_18860 [Nocardioidaceae bacterium SCSIO 66511]|nr:hypothetical protein MU582_18860 [Nocardioidaceae bacterium SCSIO 66511]